MKPGQHEGCTGPLDEPRHLPEPLDYKKAVAEFDRLWESGSGCRQRERMRQLLQVIDAVECGPAGTLTNDLSRDAWAWLAPPPEARHDSKPSAAKARLDAPGGFVGPFSRWQTQSTMCAYDPAANSGKGGVVLPGGRREERRETRTPTPQAHAALAANSPKEKFDVFGNDQRDLINRAVEGRWFYDSRTDRWKALPPQAMP